jgi:putative ABC transport system ATP-binding protein
VSAVETVWAVRDVSLTARGGEFILISGASGSGKTTLLNLIAGLDRPEQGVVRVAGIDVTSLDDTGRALLRLERVGVVFQEHRLIEEFTAVENVALPLEARGVGTGIALERAAEALLRVGLDRLGARRPDQLSGGQRQRVGIARALVGGRRVLLADEPTGSLDSKTSLEIFGLFRELCDQGVLVVLCSHDPRSASFVDRHVEMVDGELLSREIAEVPPL